MIMETKFQTQYNYSHDSQRHECIIGKSMTIPDQSLTVNQIFEKTLAGNYPAVAQEQDYDDDTQVVTYGLDLVDYDTAARNFIERSNAVTRAKKLETKRIAEEKAKEAEALLRASLRAEILEELKNKQ